jgi:DNA-binding MarR family transcriptional regulator
VKLCENAGLVARSPDPDDGRAFRISLTERGAAFQAVAEEVLSDLDDQIVAALGARNRTALVRALKGVMEL